MRATALLCSPSRALNTRVNSFHCNHVTPLGQQNPNYRLIATMTQMDKSHQPWTGNRGRLAQPLLIRYLAGMKSPIYYVVGPPGMVNGLRGLLTQTGVYEDANRPARRCSSLSRQIQLLS